MKIRFLSSGQMIDFFKEGFQKDDINNWKRALFSLHHEVEKRCKDRRLWIIAKREIDVPAMLIVLGLIGRFFGRW
jgi:hypothetical protein